MELKPSCKSAEHAGRESPHVQFDPQPNRPQVQSSCGPGPFALHEPDSWRSSSRLALAVVPISQEFARPRVRREFAPVALQRRPHRQDSRTAPSGGEAEEQQSHQSTPTLYSRPGHELKCIPPQGLHEKSFQCAKEHTRNTVLRSNVGNARLARHARLSSRSATISSFHEAKTNNSHRSEHDGHHDLEKPNVDANGPTLRRLRTRRFRAACKG